MGGEVGEVVDGVGEDGEIVNGVILSSSSSSRKFVGDEDRETECAERGRKREKNRENDRDISPDQPVSIGTSRIKSQVGNDSIGMLLQR